MQGKERM
jgi:hypothetical protein